jgi:DNA-binding NtrC family response regulator
MKKILIASNNEGVRESFKLILGEDFELILCGDPTKCPELLDHSDMRTIFLDIDGLENSTAIIEQCLKNQPKLKIITIADHKKEKSATETVATGAKGYVIKPLKQDEVLSFCR